MLATIFVDQSLPSAKDTSSPCLASVLRLSRMQPAVDAVCPCEKRCPELLAVSRAQHATGLHFFMCLQRLAPEERWQQALMLQHICIDRLLVVIHDLVSGRGAMGQVCVCVCVGRGGGGGSRIGC